MRKQYECISSMKVAVSLVSPGIAPVGWIGMKMPQKAPVASYWIKSYNNGAH